MTQKTRAISLSALLSALTVVSLFFASVWPTGLFGLVAFSSLFVAAAAIESGIVYGIYVFVVSSALGMLILPDKAAPVLFILFFGYYPVLKNLFERVKPAPVQWILKLAVFNAALTVLWFLLKDLFFSFGEDMPGIILIYLMGNAVFAVFDYGYSKVLLFYMDRVSKYKNKQRKNR